MDKFTPDELPPGKLMVIKKEPNGQEWAIILSDDHATWEAAISHLRGFKSGTIDGFADHG